MADIIVVIPAYNEEKSIAAVLRNLKALQFQIDILVVNDGSADRTSGVAQDEGVLVINLPYNLGYGGALQTGFKYAAAEGYRYLIHMDADGQHDPEDIRELIAAITKDNYDIVIGSRFLGNSSIQTGFVKRFAISIFRTIIKIATGKTVTDPSSGFQALSRKTFRYYASMGHYPQDYPDADVLIHMLKNSFRVCEIPVQMKNREIGAGMHAGLKPIYYLLKMLVSIIVVLLRGRNIIKDGALDG